MPQNGSTPAAYMTAPPAWRVYNRCVTRIPEILRTIEGGDRFASDELLPLVYEELRKLAAAKLAREAVGQTLQPTALVHEAYLRLVADNKPSGWESQRHFFAAAAEAMRRILVERARRKAAVKHGGELCRLDFDDQLYADGSRSNEILALDYALAELERHDSRAAQLVKFRYFGGLSLDEAAAALGISRRTADRIWAVARAWLFDRLQSR
jgi:RNA polymerase sigma factor (TIGR02999 family)